ncbi:MAG: hypothetical protein ACFHU9_03685 [Fluviicola sp.]
MPQIGYIGEAARMRSCGSFEPMKMNISQFQKTYENFSEKELTEIVRSEAYTINARMAAILILRERGILLPEEKFIQEEYNRSLMNEEKTLRKERSHDTKLVRRLLKIPKGQIATFPSNKWVWVEVKRLNHNRFRIRQADYWQGWMAPILILIVQSESTYIAFPFFNFRSLLLSVAISILFLFIATDNPSMPWYSPMLFPIGFMLIIQIVLLPFMYFKLLDRVKKEFGK